MHLSEVQTVHVLNGDALAERFPENFKNDGIIVCRECLVDGDVRGDLGYDFWRKRANFICSTYGGSLAEYNSQCRDELSRIQMLREDQKVYLWFEDDLFCQVNMWFVCHIIFEHTSLEKIFLVRPDGMLEKGFGGIKNDQLSQLIRDTIPLDRSDMILTTMLWKAYQHNDIYEMLSAAGMLLSKLPQIVQAVHAHIDRIPVKGDRGRPKKTLYSLMTELETDDFGTLFRAFSQREAIYGFGDFQVFQMIQDVRRNGLKPDGR